ncbi:MAG: VOC family protein [Armatimonadota bacterium]
MAHPVVHFEIAADDPERLKQFYTELFGWSIEPMQGMGGYMMVTTAEEGGQGINGGMMKRQTPQHTNTNYVLVESVADYAERAKQLGGQVVMPKSPVPGMGWVAVCLDPDGNMIGLWQTDPNAA